MTNEGPGCSHDMGVVTRMLLSMMIWCQDEVRRSRALPSFLDANSIEHVAIDVWFALSVTKKAAITTP